MKTPKYTYGIILAFVLSLSGCSGAKNTGSHVQNTSGFNLESELLKNNYEKINLNKRISGHLTLEVTLNGQAANFILDTGAGATVLDTKRKEKFGLETENIDETAAGAGGQHISMQLSQGNTLIINRLTLEDFNIYLIDLDHVNQAFLTMGLEAVDGVIGADILSAKKGIIDYENLVLYLKK